MTTPIRPSLAQLLNPAPVRSNVQNLGTATRPTPNQSPAFGSLMEAIARQSNTEGTTAISQAQTTPTQSAINQANPAIAPATFKGAAIKQSLDQSAPTRLMAPGSFLNIHV